MVRETQYLNFMVDKTWTAWYSRNPVINFEVAKIELVKREYNMVVRATSEGTIKLVKQYGMFSLGHNKAVKDDMFYIDAHPNPGYKLTGYYVMIYRKTLKFF